MRLFSLKTAFALALLTAVTFWTIDVSQAQLFRKFPPQNARPPVDNTGARGGNGGGNGNPHGGPPGQTKH